MTVFIDQKIKCEMMLDIYLIDLNVSIGFLSDNNCHY